jgi:hypothetical protein
MPKFCSVVLFGLSVELYRMSHWNSIQIICYSILRIETKLDRSKIANDDDVIGLNNTLSLCNECSFFLIHLPSLIYNER